MSTFLPSRDHFDAATTLVFCDNCDWQGTADRTNPIEAAHVRLDAGSEIPVGECPECGALAYLQEPTHGSPRANEQRAEHLLAGMCEAAARLIQEAKESVITAGSLQALTTCWVLATDHLSRNGKAPDTAASSDYKPIPVAYKPIPVAVGVEIAKKYEKSVVVLLAYDPVHQKMHTMTYGVTAKDKEYAADLGEICATVVGAGPDRQTYEDFRRDYSAGQFRELQERAFELLQACGAVIEAAGNPPPPTKGYQDLIAATNKVRALIRTKNERT